jgi:hypothetical protein
LQALRQIVPQDSTRRGPERIWSVQRAGREIDCELYSNTRGEWDCRCFDENWLISSHRLPTRRAAVAYAEAQHQALRQQGWTDLE